MKQITQKAFSLIELLFVIAIIGVMASLGVAYMQHRAANAKIERAALQIQQVLQAGQAYYADNNKWPSGYTHQAQSDFKPYLPAGLEVNPWGYGSYDYWLEGKQGKGQKFVVSTDAVNKKNAQRLIALLPNAAIDATHPTTVDAEIVATADTGTGPTGKALPIFSNMGYYQELSNGSQRTFKVYCPSGYDAGVRAAEKSVEFGSDFKTHPSFAVDSTGCTDDGVKVNDLEQWTCGIKTHGNFLKRIDVMYISECSNPKYPNTAYPVDHQ